jgi:uncharacterized membrane protein
MAERKRPILPVRIVRLHGRLLGAIAFAAILAIIAWTTTRWDVSSKLLAGWNGGVLLYLILVYSLARRGDIARLRERAAEEDEGALALLILSCVAAVASLAAIIVELGNSKNAHGLEAAASVALGMSTIILSWTFVHTCFALHYANEFYGEGRDEKIGGLKFPGTRRPDYWDFIYFAAVIAMTSQVSDVAVESASIRRIVAVHGILSFFFNLGVLALTINIISDLAK